MDKLIFDRKKQLQDIQHMLKMQDLLDEYDRQNAFLNKQVDTLLKQNNKLKQQNASISCLGSRVLNTEGYLSRGSRNSFADQNQSKSFSYQKSRKSRYQYMYDESEIKDLKANIKNQMKRQAIKNLECKQIQTNLEEFNIQIVSIKSQIKNQADKLGQSNKKDSIKFTPVKKVPQSLMDVSKQSQKSPDESKSKSKSKQKIQVSLKSRVYEDQKNTISTVPKTHSPRRQFESGHKPQFSIQQASNSGQIVLEHSFGQKDQQRLQKKFTLLESDLGLGPRQEQRMGESRITNKFLPLSIASKQLSKDISTNLPKSQLQSGTYCYNQYLAKTHSKPKKNHQLHPSPKVQFQPNPFLAQKIKPFILKTQQSFPAPSVELHRNPSQKIKRKFIKIISNKKVQPPASPPRK